MSDTDNQPLVLIVDDMPDIPELIRTGVRTYKATFDVIFAATTEEAREILASRDVAAVILDVNLVGDSGSGLAEWLHEKFPHLPKAFLTAYDRSVTHNHAEELEMEVWSKPIDMQKLIHCIYCLLRGTPTQCDGPSLTAMRRVTGPVTMPDVIKKITSSVFFI